MELHHTKSTPDGSVQWYRCILCDAFMSSDYISNHILSDEHDRAVSEDLSGISRYIFSVHPPNVPRTRPQMVPQELLVKEHDFRSGKISAKSVLDQVSVPDREPISEVIIDIPKESFTPEEKATLWNYVRYVRPWNGFSHIGRYSADTQQYRSFFGSIPFYANAVSVLEDLERQYEEKCPSNIWGIVNKYTGDIHDGDGARAPKEEKSKSEARADLPLGYGEWVSSKHSSSPILDPRSESILKLSPREAPLQPGSIAPTLDPQPESLIKLSPEEEKLQRAIFLSIQHHYAEETEHKAREARIDEEMEIIRNNYEIDKQKMMYERYTWEECAMSETEGSDYEFESDLTD